MPAHRWPGYTFDDFGRITLRPLPLTNAYYTNDLVRSITKGSTTRTWTLDPGRRFRSWSDNGGTASVNHYAGDSDSPAWVQETATAWTRNIGGIDGDLAGIYSSAAAATELQLVNLHGDVVATAATSPTVTALLATFESDEFGKPRSTSPRYGWLGGKQRATDALSGVVLMGVRLYVPTLGRFLQVDPVVGASASAYDYCNTDPVNCIDLDGRAPWWRRVLKAAAVVGGIAGAVACGASVICGVAVGAAAGAASYAASHAGTKHWSWKGFAFETGLGAALGGRIGNRGIGFGNTRFALHKAHKSMPFLKGGLKRKARWLMKQHQYRVHAQFRWKGGDWHHW